MQMNTLCMHVRERARLICSQLGEIKGEGLGDAWRYGCVQTLTASCSCRCLGTWQAVATILVTCPSRVAYAGSVDVEVEKTRDQGEELT